MIAMIDAPFLALFPFSCPEPSAVLKLVLHFPFLWLNNLHLSLCFLFGCTREEVEKLQEKLNGRNLQELLDAIEAEGFEPEGWSSEVGCQ